MSQPPLDRDDLAPENVARTNLHFSLVFRMNEIVIGHKTIGLVVEAYLLNERLTNAENLENAYNGLSGTSGRSLIISHRVQLSACWCIRRRCAGYQTLNTAAPTRRVIGQHFTALRVATAPSRNDAAFRTDNDAQHEGDDQSELEPKRTVARDDQEDNPRCKGLSNRSFQAGRTPFRRQTMQPCTEMIGKT